MTEINSQEELTSALKNPRVLVDFWAPWCGPCKQLNAVLPKLEPLAHVVKVNVDTNPEIAAQYGVRAIPTMLLFKDGELKATNVGVRPLPELERFTSQ